MQRLTHGWRCRERGGVRQDSVRVLTVPVLVTLAGLLPHAEAKSLLLAHTKALAGDKSWRVRYMFAEQIVDVRARSMCGGPGCRSRDVADAPTLGPRAICPPRDVPSCTNSCRPRLETT